MLNKENSFKGATGMYRRYVCIYIYTHMYKEGRQGLQPFGFRIPSVQTFEEASVSGSVQKLNM